MTFKSKADISALAAPTTRAFIEVWHEVYKTLGVRVMRAHATTGEVRRTFIARYRDSQGKDKKTVLGLVSELQLDDAIDRARDLARDARVERQTGLKRTPTLRESYDKYMLLREESLAPATIEDYNKKFALLAPWHDKSVAALGESDWTNIYLKIKEKHKRASAVMACKVAKAVYAMLVRDGTLRRAPFSELVEAGVFKRQEPTAVLIKAADLPKVWSWLHMRAHPSMRDFILIAMLTGLRLSVVAQLRWEQVDREQRTYVIPADERGNKTKKLVAFPIPDYVYDNIIAPRWQHRRSDADCVIESYKYAKRSLKSARGTFESLRNDTSIYASMHALRRTYATIADNEVGTLMTARLLTHSARAAGDQLRVTAGYIVASDDALREAANKVCQAVLRLSGVSER